MQGGQDSVHDWDVTIYSPEGRIIQMEYAAKAASKNTEQTCVISGQNGAVMLTAMFNVPPNFDTHSKVPPSVYYVPGGAVICFTGYAKTDETQIHDSLCVRYRKYAHRRGNKSYKDMLIGHLKEIYVERTLEAGRRPIGVASFLIGAESDKSKGFWSFCLHPQVYTDSIQTEMYVTPIVASSRSLHEQVTRTVIKSLIERKEQKDESGKELLEQQEGQLTEEEVYDFFENAGMLPFTVREMTSCLMKSMSAYLRQFENDNDCHLRGTGDTQPDTSGVVLYAVQLFHDDSTSNIQLSSLCTKIIPHSDLINMED